METEWPYLLADPASLASQPEVAAIVSAAVEAERARCADIAAGWLDHVKREHPANRIGAEWLRKVLAAILAGKGE